MTMCLITVADYNREEGFRIVDVGEIENNTITMLKHIYDKYVDVVKEEYPNYNIIVRRV